MKALSQYILEADEDRIYYSLCYNNKETDLKQIVSLPASSKITAKQMKAWVESKGATFKSFRKITYDKYRHFIVYNLTDKYLDEILKF